jgi:ketosteroid isomerase-like protein
MATDYSVLKRMYEAFNGREIDAILAMLHPDVDWANGWEGGRIHGVENVREYWTRQWAAIDPHVEPEGFSVDDENLIVVDVHQIVRDRDGKVLREDVVQHAYVFEDGLIRSMDIRRP